MKTCDGGPDQSWPIVSAPQLGLFHIENIDFKLELIVQSGGLPYDGPIDYDWSASSPVIADIDGDEKLDIIVANGTCIQCSPSGLSILRNTSADTKLGFEYEYSNFYQYQSNKKLLLKFFWFTFVQTLDVFKI